MATNENVQPASDAIDRESIAAFVTANRKQILDRVRTALGPSRRLADDEDFIPAVLQTMDAIDAIHGLSTPPRRADSDRWFVISVDTSNPSDVVIAGTDGFPQSMVDSAVSAMTTDVLPKDVGTLALFAKASHDVDDAQSSALAIELAEFIAGAMGKHLPHSTYSSGTCSFDLRQFASRAIAEECIDHFVHTQTPHTTTVMSGERDDLREALASASGYLDHLEPTYSKRREGVSALFDGIRRVVANSIEPALNDATASMPQATYEEKKALAKWINAELRSVGLAIKCPKTARPSILLGHATGAPGIGRFHLETTDETGKTIRTLTAKELPQLHLTLADMAWPKARSQGRGR